MHGIILAILIMALGSHSSLGQRARYKPQTHQIELRAAGLDWMSGHQQFDVLGNTPLVFSGVNGIRYQYNRSLANAFRLGATYTPSTWTASEPIGGFSAYTADLVTTDLHLGYVRRYHIGPLQWYAGADLRGGMSSLNENGEQINGMYDNKYEVLHYGLSAVAGLRTYLNPYVSFSLEANATYLRHQPQVAVVSELPYQIFGEQTFHSGISAWLAFHFVPLKKRCTCPKVRRGP